MFFLEWGESSVIEFKESNESGRNWCRSFVGQFEWFSFEDFGLSGWSFGSFVVKINLGEWEFGSQFFLVGELVGSKQKRLIFWFKVAVFLFRVWDEEALFLGGEKFEWFNFRVGKSFKQACGLFRAAATKKIRKRDFLF